MTRLTTILLAVLAPLITMIASGETPEQAAQEHMTALMALDKTAIAGTMKFPFVHMNPDGTKQLITSVDEVRTPENLPYRSKCIETRVIEEFAISAIVLLVAERRDLEGEFAGTARAYWGAVKTDDGWLISWRQFMGVKGGT